LKMAKFTAKWQAVFCKMGLAENFLEASKTESS